MRVYQLISTANSKEQIKLPVNPSQFELDDPQLNQKITLLNVGEANQLGSVGLITGSLSSFFPSSSSPFYKRADRSPQEYLKLLEKWKDSSQPVRLIVSDTGINIAMTIDNIHTIRYEGDKDIYYTIDLTEYKSLNVPTVKIKTSVKKTITAARPAAKSPKQKVKQQKKVTHTIKGGDTLWSIAVKYYGNGSKYPKIYNANKDAIEKAAKKHGFASSDKGHWIWAGTKLVIPK